MYKIKQNMYKIKQKKTKPSIKYLELRENDDNIELACHIIDDDEVIDWVILTIYQNGEIRKIENVHKECGFELDMDGAVVIR